MPMADSPLAAHLLPPRQGLSPAGPVRRLAGQSRDLVLGRRDPGGLLRGLSQGQRPGAAQHRPRPARGASAGAEQGRRAHLDDRGPGRRGVADPRGQGPARGHARRAEGEAWSECPGGIDFTHPDFALDGPHDRRRTRGRPGSRTRPTAAITGPARSACPSSARPGSPRGPITSSTARTIASSSSRPRRPTARRAGRSASGPATAASPGSSSAGSARSPPASRSCPRPCG